MQRILVVIGSLFWLTFQATPSWAADIRTEDLVWAELFDMSQLDMNLPTDTEPEGRIDLRCRIINHEGHLTCRVVRSALDPDPKGEYSRRIAAIVEQGGRIDMAKTPGAGVGKFFVFAVVITIPDT